VVAAAPAGAARPHCLAVGNAAMEVSINASTASDQASNAASAATQIGATELATAATSAATAAMTASQTTQAAGFSAQNNLNYSLEQMQLKVETAISAINAALTACNNCENIVENVLNAIRLASSYPVIYNTFNGSYASDVNINEMNPRLEIDLAASYSINNIKVYLSAGSNPTVTAYNELGNTVTISAITFPATIPTAIQPYPNWGIKTRYIGINTAAANAQIYNLVVVDSLGRNLAFKNSAKSSNGSPIYHFGNTYNATTAINLPTTYTELDLGQEHFITSVSVYSTYTGTPTLISLPTADTSLQGATVTLMDAYYNRVPRILAGLGSQYNNTWPLGASLGPYYRQSPPTGVTVVPGTDGAIWSFPTTEKIIETCVTSVPTTIYAMVVSSTDTIYYTTNSGVYKVSVTQSITHPNSVFISNSNLRAITLSNDETQLWICSLSENKVYAYNTSNGLLLKVFGGATREGLSCQLNTADRSTPSPAPTVNITNCSFNNPMAIIMDSWGFVYVLDAGNYLIRKIDPIFNSVSTYSGTTACGVLYSSDPDASPNGMWDPQRLWSDPQCPASTQYRYYADNKWKCARNDNYKIITIVEPRDLSTYFSSWASLTVGSTDPIFNIEDFGTITPAPAYTDGYYDVTLPTGITLASSFGPGKFVWPGIESPISIEPNSKGRLQRDKIRIGRNKKSNSYSNSVLSTIYFHDIQNNTIRRSREFTRTGYCEAKLSTPVPANSFALTKTLIRRPYSADTTVSSAHVIPISGNYPATTNTALYPNGTQAEGINNQYYTLPDRPFAGPYNNTTRLPLVDPTAQFFVTATFSETLNFTPPGQPMFTITSVTNTNFVLTVTSRGSDYATSYTYILNGGAAQALTLSGTNTATITAPAHSYTSIIVTGINGDDSTASLIRYVQLLPPAPSITLVAASVTSTAFSISWTHVAAPGNTVYTTSYTYSLNGGGPIAVLTGATTLNIPGLTVGSSHTIVLRTIYTSGSDTLISLPSNSLSIQLAPPAPSITLDAASVTSTAFRISWAHVAAPGNGAYTRSYSYSLNGGTDMSAGAGTTVTITGLIAGSNNSVVLRAIYTSSSETLTSLPSNSLSIQLVPPAPSITLVAASVTSTAFSISWTHVAAPGNAAYTRSYNYSLNNAVPIALTAETTTVNITGLPESSSNSIVVRAIYTSSSETLTSPPSSLLIQLAPSRPVLTLSSLTGFENNTNPTITWPTLTAPNGFTSSYTWTLTNALVWNTLPSSIGDSVVGTINQVAFRGASKTLSVYKNQWVAVSDIEIYDNTKSYPTGGFVLFTDNNVYILNEGVGQSGFLGGYIPGSYHRWMNVASIIQTTGTVTTASKTFTGIIRPPATFPLPTVTVISKYISTTDSTEISSIPSEPLTLTIASQPYPPEPVLTLSNTTFSQNNMNHTITWPTLTAPNGFTSSYTWTLTNALVWNTLPSSIGDSVVGTNNQVAFRGASKTLSVYKNQWVAVSNIEIYDNTRVYPTGAFVLYTNNNAYILNEGVGQSGFHGGWIPGSYHRWMNVASIIQTTGTVTTASKTFTGIIHSPVSSSVPTVTVVSKYISTTDSTEISSIPSEPLMLILGSPPPEPVLTLSSLTGSESNKNIIITWPTATAPNGFTSSYIWTLTNALVWYTLPSSIEDSVVGTNNQVAFRGASQTLSIYKNQWVAVSNIEIYDNTRVYPTGAFVLYTNNNAYILDNHIGQPSHKPGIHAAWMNVANTAQRTGTVTTASKTFTGIIRSPAASAIVTVVSKYVSTTDSTEVSSAPSAPLTITM
jgi:hypothetical protein